MSLVKTLAKIAVGAAVAKGVNEVAKSRAGKGSVLDGMRRSGSAGGGLEGMLGQVLSGRGGSSRSGGLGGLLESLSQSSRPQPPGSGAATAEPEPPRGSLGDLLNQSFQGYGEPEQAPSQREEEHAALLLRAMIMAVKADGKIDPGEQKRLTDHLQDADQSELAFVEEQIRAPVDPQGLAAETPRDQRAQVYLMSIMAIDINSDAETRYLRDLASALDLDGATVTAIHERLGVPAPA